MITFGQVRRLASVLGADPDDLAHAVYDRGADGIEIFVDRHFEEQTAAEEERLGDALLARLGADPSPLGVGRVYGESDGDLSDAWLARCGIEEPV